MISFFNNYFTSINKSLVSIDYSLLDNTVQVLTHSESVGGKVIIVGNGGSAAIASHVSVDFTKAANLRSTNFNEADLITCFSNDYGYENWVAQALEAYADLNDVVILISSSGKSKNMINGGKQCKAMNIPLITFTGFNSDNALRRKGDINFWVESNHYNVVEMTHHIWLLAIVDYIINKQN
jgi:D-sedoheptulose 7-phosphate isomerase